MFASFGTDLESTDVNALQFFGLRRSTIKAGWRSLFVSLSVEGKLKSSSTSLTGMVSRWEIMYNSQCVLLSDFALLLSFSTVVLPAGLLPDFDALLDLWSTTVSNPVILYSDFLMAAASCSKEQISKEAMRLDVLLVVPCSLFLVNLGFWFTFYST